MGWLDRFSNAIMPSLANGIIGGANLYVAGRVINEMSTPFVSDTTQGI